MRYLACDAENGVTHHHMVGDEENIPLPPESVDLVFSSMSAHWVSGTCHITVFLNATGYC